MAESLAEVQKRFAAHLRNPQQNPAPDDISDRRLAIYRRLFFNNISSLLASTFPVVHAILGEETWKQLIREFFTDYRAQTPLFPQIPREFLQYLQDHRQNHPEDPPFLLELAHYEWVELALEIEEQDVSTANADPGGDLMEEVPVVSPLAWMLTYRYPVHQIRPEFMPGEPPEQPTHLVVYRRSDFSVKFMQSNIATIRLLEILKEDQGLSGGEAAQRVAAELGLEDPTALVNAAEKLMNDLRDREIILGTKPNK